MFLCEFLPRNRHAGRIDYRFRTQPATRGIADGTGRRNPAHCDELLHCQAHVARVALNRSTPRASFRRVGNRYPTPVGGSLSIALENKKPGELLSGLFYLHGREGGRWVRSYSRVNLRNRSIKSLRDRPRLAVADRAAVDLHHRNHFRGAAGEKTFVGDVHVVLRERHFADFNFRRAGHLDHRVARDAFQNAGIDRRRLQYAVAHQEDVVARALGDFALVVQHQRFDAAGLQAFDLRQDVVQIIERLDARAQRRRMVADRAGGDDLQAVA